MYKLFGFIPLKSGWSRADWLAHYRERHGPLVAGTHPFAAKFEAYAQNYVLADWDHGADQWAPIAVSELWISELRMVTEAFSLPEYQNKIRADEDHFTDQSMVQGGVGEEAALFRDFGDDDRRWSTRPRLKLFICHWPQEGVDIGHYRKQWTLQAQKFLNDRSVPMRGYSLTFPLDALSPGLSNMGAMEEFWFDSAEAAFPAWETLKVRKEGPAIELTGRSRGTPAWNHFVFGDLDAI